MDVGFTGTQGGMTEAQRKSLRTVLKELHSGELGEDEFHYGACVGADSQAVLEAFDVGYVIVAYPANDVAMTKQGLIHEQAVAVASMPALRRNKMIVDNSDILIAAPKYMSESLRSGTWSTVRYARKQSKPIIYIWPDGKVQR